VKIKAYLWQIELQIPIELEESFVWKLDELGISSFSFDTRPEKLSLLQLSIWLPCSEFSAEELEELIKSLIPLAETFEVNLPDPRWKKVNQEDWSSTWKKYWNPDPIGKKLLILPEWIDPPEIFHGREIVRIDPGSAFGTGTHPSTRLCLEFLEREPLDGLHIGDLGCGSGILALTAITFGANKAFCVDIDSFAINSTKRNSLINNFGPESIVVSQGSIDVLHSMLQARSLDLVLCNILAPVIKELIPNFNKILKKEGFALLSGILSNQVKDLKKTLDLYGWKIARTWQKSNWALIQIDRT
tara:strand:+ start:8363 stop:9265 length:903 start_codon:yes stop_codon:yes gene_type:complete